MRLKSVELFGFKSFPDRTVIEFGDGITAILGPNGCGKSNVVDAIKWVLGEKSAKSLRGEEMLDVIFSGCETRSPSGMAEVKLNFDTSDHSLPPPYGDFDEICVTRRLHRNRESEYFINKERCRLKHIKELFLDTGIGSSAYSVIEQGRVEALLHAKPADRRAVFEEAAGIAKFKVKRKEILSRLEKTSQILLRFSDKVEEKERQIRKVANQASAARRHRKLTAERDQLRNHLYRRQYAEQQTLFRELRKQREVLEMELSREEASLASLGQEITRLTMSESEFSGNREAVMKAAEETQEALSGVQVAQAEARSRIASLTSEINLGNQRRAELSARLDRLGLQENEVRERLAEAETRASELEERYLSQDRDRQQLLQEVERADADVSALRVRIIDLNRRRQEASEKAAGLEAAEQSATSRLSEIQARLDKIVGEEEAINAALADSESRYQQAAAECGAAADCLAEMRSRRGELAAAGERLQAEERAAESERAAKASRKNALEDLENSFAGAYEGVKNILTAARDNHPDCRGVVGMALDLMTVPQDLALALETILGAAAQDVVVETARDAQSAIEHLKRHRLGRATFLPLDRIQPRRRLTQSFRHIPGVIGEAVDLVQFDRRHSVVMEHLLAGVLVVEDLTLARELAGREARGVRIVTRDGDVINPSGAMTGGHGKHRPAGLVQRKAELDALVGDLADCERRLSEVSRRRGESVAAMRTLGEEIANIEHSLAEAGRSENGLKQNLAVRRSEQQRILRDRTETEAEREGLAAGGDGRRVEIDELRHTLALVSDELAGLENEIAVKTEEQRRNREAIEAKGQEFATLSGERSSALSRVRELSGRIEELAREQEECRVELDRPGISNSEAEAEIASLKERLAELQNSETELLRTRDERKSTAAEIAEQLAQCREQMESLRQRERESRTQSDRVRDGLAQIDRRGTECELHIANIREKAREELGLEDLEPALPAAGESAIVDEDGGLLPPQAESQPEEERPEWFDLPDSELQKRIDDVMQKIRNIGNVNLEAIDELAELEAAAEFMRSHKEEQEEAVATMREAIDKLNTESSTRFQETFATVRINFQQMFTRLFGGGKADLFLEEVTDPEADPLDAGIDISAQPPGKEPKNISLLSGGEKALCAVALLFALFQSKPSPFCILDEVDGPLDESNIDRFMQQVKDFTGNTQFIIITHSQRTMGMTDMIWGVTQKVPGISTLNSLKFQTMESLSKETPSGKREAEYAVSDAASA